MKKIPNMVVTGFFVAVLGILWYFSTKYHIKPDRYTVVIYDVFGKEAAPNGLRTEFKTRPVAYSHISEYQKAFPHYSFSIMEENPERWREIPRAFKRI